MSHAINQPKELQDLRQTLKFRYTCKRSDCLKLTFCQQPTVIVNVHTQVVRLETKGKERGIQHNTFQKLILESTQLRSDENANREKK